MRTICDKFTQPLQTTLDELSDVRRDFIKKVYGITTAQVLLTIILTAIIYSSTILQAVSVILLIPAIITSLVICIILMCTKLSKKVPTNYVLLGVFTFMESISVGLICSMFDTGIVMTSLFLTTIIFGVLTYHAFTTSTRYFSKFPVIIELMAISSLFILIISFFYWNGILETIAIMFGAIFAGFYVIFDTQLIMERVEEDDYIKGALMLYTDIIRMFLEVLKILARLMKNNKK